MQDHPSAGSLQATKLPCYLISQGNSVTKSDSSLGYSFYFRLIYYHKAIQQPKLIQLTGCLGYSLILGLFNITRKFSSQKLQWRIQMGAQGARAPPYFLILYLIATTLTAKYSKPWLINSLTSYLYKLQIIPYAYRINNLSFGFPLTNGRSFILTVSFVILISVYSRVIKF